MVKPLHFARASRVMAAFAFTGHFALTGVAAAQAPPDHEPSLQSPPFATPAFSPTPQAGKQAPASAPEQSASFESIASQFDPSKQRLIWVLPPGLHGKGPWGFTATVKADDVQQYKTSLPLVAQLLPAGSRPEYPAGFEVVRLTSDGAWTTNTAGIDKAVADVIAKFGHGHGELELANELNLTIDAGAKTTYCAGGKPADIRVFLEEDGKPGLTRLDEAGMTGIFQKSVDVACHE